MRVNWWNVFMNTKNNSKCNITKSKDWSKRSIENLGNAKDIVANVNLIGGGDTQFDLLVPS